MSSAPRPYTLVAELTYACPLHCVYCSNPVDFTRHEDALDAADWRRVLREAERLGVVQVNFTGGEPLLRPDLEALVEEARSLDLYSNLITSGIPLARERLERLRRLGLDNVQVSIQDARPDASDRIAGREAFHRKIEVARWVKELGFPLTVNTVLHRENLERIGEVIALAEELHADRLELANAQYLGWALRNRTALLPTKAQLERARFVAAAARARASLPRCGQPRRARDRARASKRDRSRRRSPSNGRPGSGTRRNRSLAARSSGTAPASRPHRGRPQGRARTTTALRRSARGRSRKKGPAAYARADKGEATRRARRR